MVMERSEPSLVPEWLKGATGNGVVAPQLSQAGLYPDDGGSSALPRHRGSQQLPVVGGGPVDYDSPRGSAASDRGFFPSIRRGSGNSSSSVEKVNADRENLSQGRPYSGFTRSAASVRSYDIPEWDRDAFRGDGGRNDRDWDRESDRDFWSRERDRPFGFGTDEREKERDRIENGMLRPSIAGTSGKHEADTMLRRSQSMGLSPRIPDNGLWKMNEVINIPSAVPSVSGGLVSSMQKAAFERNFPSLGADEKLGVRPMSPGNASTIASPRPLWQGSSRSDLGRASSPGLTSSYGGSISTTSPSLSGGPGGTDLWSSALAESPSLNGNLQPSGVAVINVPVSTAGLTSSASSGAGSAASVNVLNMAEAVSQIPSRVRIPPQPSIESQRLEEFALKQSRQLIPMTPSLPKTMSMVDKAKSKPLRTIDGLLTSSFKGSQPSGSLQLNSPHRSLTPAARPDTPKLSQGKLLVLKASKDGGAPVLSTPKSDGNNAPQGMSHGNIGLMASAMSVAGVSAVPATGVIGQRKQSLDRRATLVSGVTGPDAFAGLRGNYLTYIGEDKPLSLQAQNRSEFFNALRKKAASNGSVSYKSNKSDLSLQPKSEEVMNLREALVLEETVVSAGHGSDVKGTCLGQDSDSIQFTSETLSNGDIKQSPEADLFMDDAGRLMEESSAVDSLERTNVAISLPGDSEEEEAAFMRSLGWEENAEGSELTEEEISAFYQMREKKNLYNSRGNHWFTSVGVEHGVGSLGSVSSGISSSDSESDVELHAKHN